MALNPLQAGKLLPQKQRRKGAKGFSGRHTGGKAYGILFGGRLCLCLDGPAWLAHPYLLDAGPCRWCGGCRSARRPQRARRGYHGRRKPWLRAPSPAASICRKLRLRRSSPCAQTFQRGAHVLMAGSGEPSPNRMPRSSRLKFQFLKQAAMSLHRNMSCKGVGGPRMQSVSGRRPRCRQSRQQHGHVVVAGGKRRPEMRQLRPSPPPAPAGRQGSCVPLSPASIAAILRPSPHHRRRCLPVHFSAPPPNSAAAMAAAGVVLPILSRRNRPYRGRPGSHHSQ